MSIRELKLMNVKELRAKAKELNISGRWEMTKDNLIEAIVKSVNAEVSESDDSQSQNAKDEKKIEANQIGDSVEAVDKSEKKTAGADIVDVKVDMEQKMPYIENAEVGTLVAFRLPGGKVKSAKIVRKSSTKRKLKLETEYGAVYIVSFDDVVWVRTGTRWPRGVYNLLKGLKRTVSNNDEKEQDVEAK